MKIKTLRHIQTSEGHCKPGDVCELADPVAERLIADGAAEKAGAKAKVTVAKGELHDTGPAETHAVDGSGEVADVNDGGTDHAESVEATEEHAAKDAKAKRKGRK